MQKIVKKLTKPVNVWLGCAKIRRIDENFLQKYDKIIAFQKKWCIIKPLIYYDVFIIGEEFFQRHACVI